MVPDKKITRRKMILVVDDNRSLLDSLSELLEREGFAPEPAGDAESARALYRRRRPDLVLLDCDIRGYDGLDLLSDFRAQPPASPVIVTAVHTPATRTSTAPPVSAEISSTVVWRLISGLAGFSYC